MGDKGRLGRRMERAMDFPGGTLAKTALVELEGNRRAVVSGCRGILAYTEDCISLRVPEGMLTFYGQAMEVNCLTADGVTVVGLLQRIEFTEEDIC